MFTGLVEGQGIVSAVVAEGAAIRIKIEVPAEFAGDAQIGESVAINGCCLTLVDFEQGVWTFQAGEETLARTNLGSQREGDRLNLERSLPAGGRLGGHFVQGHVDGTGTIDQVESCDDWTTMWFSVSALLAAQMVPKGSVAVDGVSLTVVQVKPTRFSVALIPHTLAVTTLGRKGLGEQVNIETDILGKYIQKFMSSLSSGNVLESGN